MTYPTATALAIHGGKGLRAAAAGCPSGPDRGQAAILAHRGPDRPARGSENARETAEDGLEVMV